MGLCCSGPIDLSPIDSHRVGVSLEGSVPIALFSDPELPVIFSTMHKVGQGLSHPCTQVQIHHARMYLKEWVTRYIHALHAVGFQGWWSI